MVMVPAVAMVETMVAMEEEEEGAITEATAMVAMVAKEEAVIVAILAEVMNIIKVGSVTDFQCCGKNMSAVATF